MLSVYEFQRKCIAVFSVTKEAIQEWDKEAKKKDSIVTLNTSQQLEAQGVLVSKSRSNNTDHAKIVTIGVTGVLEL